MYKRQRMVYGAVLALFLFYSVGMLWLLFGRTKFTVYDSYWEQISMNMNLQPFRTIMEYVRLLGRGNRGLWTFRIRDQSVWKCHRLSSLRSVPSVFVEASAFLWVVSALFLYRAYRDRAGAAFYTPRYL